MSKEALEQLYRAGKITRDDLEEIRDQIGAVIPSVNQLMMAANALPDSLEKEGVLETAKALAFDFAKMTDDRDSYIAKVVSLKQENAELHKMLDSVMPDLAKIKE